MKIHERMVFDPNDPQDFSRVATCLFTRNLNVFKEQPCLAPQIRESSIAIRDDEIEMLVMLDDVSAVPANAFLAWESLRSCCEFHPEYKETLRDLFRELLESLVDDDGCIRGEDVCTQAADLIIQRFFEDRT